MEFRFDGNNGFSSNSSEDPFMFNAGSTNSDFSWTNPSSQASSTVRRKSVPTSVTDLEIVKPKKRTRRSAPKAKYIAPAKSRKRVKTKNKSLSFTWNRLGLIVCTLLLTRLVFMENGVIDYYLMQDIIAGEHMELEMLKAENTALVSEIHDLKTNPVYQKKVARDHLGVIANNEFLVLFAGEK